MMIQTLPMLEVGKFIVPTGSGPVTPIDLSSIVQFGRCNKTGDAKQWVVCKTADQTILMVPMAKQTAEATKLIRARLKGVFADAWRSKVEIAFGWADQ